MSETSAEHTIYGIYRDCLRHEDPVALVTVINGPDVGAKLLVRPGHDPVGTLGDADLDRVVARDALAELEAGATEVRHYGPHGEARMDDVAVFIESRAPRAQMLIFGAVDFTRALADQGKLLGFRVTVCDAREVFATELRFPMADEVVVDWPHRLIERAADRLGPRDAICVLTHDNKFDVPAIVAALATDVGYIGAMGSRRTHAKRVEKLREAGVTDDQLLRVKAPIGLDIGARTPEETAVSVVAEIISNRTGHRAASLSETSGPIH